MSETATNDKLKADVVELVQKIDTIIKSADKEKLSKVSVQAEQFKALLLKGMKADWKPATFDLYAEKFPAVQSAYAKAQEAAEKELRKVEADYGVLLADIVKIKKVAFAAQLKEHVQTSDTINTDLRADYAKDRSAKTIKTYRDKLDALDREIATEKAKAEKAAAADAAADKDDGKSWKFKDDKADYSAEITQAANKAALAQYEKFAAAAKKDKIDPIKVAESLGIECKPLKGSSGKQYEIKLSGKQRATFTIDQKSLTTTVKQVGGHT